MNLSPTLPSNTLSTVPYIRFVSLDPAIPRKPQTTKHHEIPPNLAFIAVYSPRLYELGIGYGRYSTPEAFPAGWSRAPEARAAGHLLILMESPKRTEREIQKCR